MGKKYLIVLDDLYSIKEWTDVEGYFPRMVRESRIIVTTRVKEITRHCPSKMTHILEPKILEEKDTLDLFTEKVFLA